MQHWSRLVRVRTVVSTVVVLAASGLVAIGHTLAAAGVAPSLVQQATAQKAKFSAAVADSALSTGDRLIADTGVRSFWQCDREDVGRRRQRRVH